MMTEESVNLRGENRVPRTKDEGRIKGIAHYASMLMPAPLMGATENFYRHAKAIHNSGKAAK